MNQSNELFQEKLSLLPIIPRYSQDKHKNITQPSICMSGSLYAYINQNINTDRQATSVSQSVNLKSQRYNQLNFSKRQHRKFNSLKCSLRKSLDTNKIVARQIISNKQKEMNKRQKQNQSKEYSIKNSLMNKLLSHHKKAEKLHFQDTRTQLFANFHKSSIKISQNFSDIKQHASNAPHEKITALLSDRPFKKSSPLKCNIGRLKLAHDLKQMAKRNVLINASFNQMHFAACNKKQDQNIQYTSDLKNISSMRQMEKPFMKTDALKKNVRSVQKLDRFQNPQHQSRSRKKKSILLISDDQIEQNNLDTILSESLLSSKFILGINKDVKPNQTRQNKQKKCQQKILHDLVKLEQMRNKQTLADAKMSQFKSSRIYAQNFRQVKLMVKDKNQDQNQKIKYIVKFKTQPRQNPKQKLQAKLSEIIPKQYLNRIKHISSNNEQIPEINGFAQALKERNIQISGKIQKQQIKQRISSQSYKFKGYCIQKQVVSGWQIQKQTQGRDNWNFN